MTTQRCKPADNLVRDVDMPGRDPAVERDAEVPLGAADDEPMVADADGLAIGLAVVEDRQHGDRRPHRRAERDRGTRRGGRWRCRDRGRGFDSDRRAGLPSFVPRQQCLTDVVFGLDQGARPLDRLLASRLPSGQVGARLDQGAGPLSGRVRLTGFVGL